MSLRYKKPATATELVIAYDLLRSHADYREGQLLCLLRELGKPLIVGNEMFTLDAEKKDYIRTVIASGSSVRLKDGYQNKTK